MQDIRQSTSSKQDNSSNEGFQEVTIPIMTSNSTAVTDEMGASSACVPSTTDARGNDHPFSSDYFKDVAVSIGFVEKSSSLSCAPRASSLECDLTSSTTAEVPRDKMPRLDSGEISSQFFEIGHELMDSLFRCGSSSVDNHQPVTSSPVHNFVEDVELNHEWNDGCSDDLNGRYCEQEEDMFDSYKDIEENLTFTYEDEDLTQDLDNGDQPSERQDAQPNDTCDTTPLYPMAKVTLGTTMVLFALLSIKYSLSADAMGNILALLSLILPAGHVLPTTVNKFKKYFRNLRTPLTMHHYCSFCLTYIGKNDKLTCPNGGCLKDLTEKSALSYFVEIPMLDQLRTFFSRSTFYDDIQHRFKKPKQPDGIITDIYDGRLYKELVEKGILSCKDNISFTMNTDGVPVFKSSKVSIWPVYLIVNELPYTKRMTKENMLLSGLWFSEKKPAMWTFLKPQFESLRQLEEGIELEAPRRGKFTCKGVVLAWTCDLPARCLVCNHMQFNGEYGCWKCLQPGQTVKAAGGHARVFPYQANDPKGPLRNMEDTLKHAQEAAARHQAGDKRYQVMGVKGPTWLSLLENYDIVRGVGIDYMHGVLLGVQKLMLKLWFSPSFARKPYSISTLAEVLDKRLRHITPTLDIGRLPRSVTEHMKYWKANELKSFLLYYGIPTLYGLLPDAYFNHYILFVHAIYLLLKDTISESDLSEAEALLNRFCALFSDLYEERFVTLNIHQLLHLPDDVRDLGPLYTHSCFSFEDKNGFILKQIHGTQSIDSQILYALTLTQKIPELREKCIIPDSEEEELYLGLSYSHKPKRGRQILPGVFILGTPYKKNIDNDTFAALEQFIGQAPGSVQVTAYNRIEFKSSYIYGTSYKRMSRRNCATIKYTDICNSICFGQVQYFIEYRQANHENVHQLAIVKPLTCHGYAPSSHISVILLNQEVNPVVVVVNISSICCNCIYISLPDEAERAYVCEFPNRYEQE